ncbi:hypothetical protein CLV88_11810 [Shimia abyssi]|uniref:Uncharacterized protein n=1 Tax=Shimia abyssi TaxID=1662395 RepID=A0A2P8F6J9_9RHOB|nr:hypothetical protein CLV88_11810 [Shimia abyssi]
MMLLGLRFARAVKLSLETLEAAFHTLETKLPAPDDPSKNKGNQNGFGSTKSSRRIS